MSGTGEERYVQTPTPSEIGILVEHFALTVQKAGARHAVNPIANRVNRKLIIIRASTPPVARFKEGRLLEAKD